MMAILQIAPILSANIAKNALLSTNPALKYSNITFCTANGRDVLNDYS